MMRCLQQHLSLKNGIKGHSVTVLGCVTYHRKCRVVRSEYPSVVLLEFLIDNRKKNLVVLVWHLKYN